MDNRTRRDQGLVYVTDEAVMAEMARARRLTQQLNTMDRAEFAALAAVVGQLLGRSEGACITPPFYCDYGSHIEVGKHFFANYNCCFLDVAKIKFGDNCMLGPNVAVYTAGHPVHPDTRRSGYEYGAQVTVGDDVWIGGNAVLCPGVHVGSGTVIGAGSVVTRDLPAGVVAGGNPCRVIRPITEADRRFYFRDRQIDQEAWDKITDMGDDARA